MIFDMFSSPVRPALRGERGAVSAAHPSATAAGQWMLARGGSAADAVIAAQAVLSVICPEAGGLGGDAFFMARDAAGQAVAVNAAGASAAAADPAVRVGEDGSSVTVPGMVAGWGTLHGRFGRLPLSAVLEPAIVLAESGCRVRPQLARAVDAQRSRLVRAGAGDWAVVIASDAGAVLRQPELARTLRSIAQEGPRWFYDGPLARTIAGRVSACGGRLDAGDFARHDSVVVAPVSLSWRGATVHVQPPASQGVLLAMALKGLTRLADVPADRLDHACVELTEAAFAFRHRAGEGAALLDESLAVNLDRAARRGGPRAYLHTAGAAASDADGLVIASLLSVFDDFGSCIPVPEGGFVLNNRAAGFTLAPNDFAPGKLPVHTLAPILVEADGFCAGLATPGADGQVQTLLQVLAAVFVAGADLASAIDKPRWRSEGGELLIEREHPAAERLAALGHDLRPLPAGDMRFGGVVCAGLAGQAPFAVSDWRRENWSGVV